ncbi:hypothetical protein PoB_004502500 [Plakobranchus ocellatus]|uniref:Uncharacterized protein n=1 Tax=Plakobranchus ocellatus TaxID=259542 RepID=A0AAV4BD43_9GAST|nr:hypothetical protein PoB_004502500 [Plakobranchus ocellatus]
MPISQEAMPRLKEKTGIYIRRATKADVIDEGNESDGESDDDPRGPSGSDVDGGGSTLGDDDETDEEKEIIADERWIDTIKLRFDKISLKEAASRIISCWPL